MRRFIIILYTLCFCTISYADTFDIDWFVDGADYAQTSCQIGDNVDLPTTPTKRGHTFDGWSEIFNRGTWAKWANVPRGASSYPTDSNGNTTPLAGDYMIVQDASDYVYEFVDTFTFKKRVNGSEDISIIHNGATTTITPSSGTMIFGINDTLKMVQEGNYRYIYANKPIRVDGTMYEVGQRIYYYNGWSGDVNNHVVNVIADPGDYVGTWRFIYDGTWATNGKYGWVPKYKID